MIEYGEVGPSWGVNWKSMLKDMGGAFSYVSNRAMNFIQLVFILLP